MSDMERYLLDILKQAKGKTVDDVLYELWMSHPVDGTPMCDIIPSLRVVMAENTGSTEIRIRLTDILCVDNILRDLWDTYIITDSEFKYDREHYEYIVEFTIEKGWAKKIMDNITVRELIEKNVGMLVPTIIICEKGSGQIYSGPITTIPEHLKNRKYAHANVYPSTGELIVTVEEETK